MLWNLLALTPLHIALLAAGGGLIVLLAVLGIVFSRGKKNEAETPEETVPAKEAAPEEMPEETASEEVVLAETLSAARSAEEPANEQAAPPLAVQENAKGAAALSVPVSAADAPSTDVPADADAQPTRVIYAEEDGWYVRVRYDKSFEAKLIQSSAQVKAWYRALKEELLSYKKVSARRSWQHEAFRLGRGPVAKLVIRGKTLRLYLALDPAAYEGGKYLVEDASEHAKFEKTPLLYRIKNDRRCRYAKELIAEAIARAGGERGEAYLDAEDIPYEETAALIERGLVRIVEVRRRTDGAGGTDFPEDEPADEEEDEIPEAAEAEESAAEPPASLPDPAAEHRVSVAAAEQLMTDDEALVLDAAARSDRYRQTIVNIDTLGQYFADGERVTIEEMRERIPFFDRKATAVKVLARGVLNKTLEVEADDFSIAAVKMILLLNGKAYRRMP